jgi:lipopolysaccharide/colanic/teichoic acid biosynthesis glycosyltransferase
MSFYKLYLKRFFDIIFSTLILLVLAIPIAVIAVLNLLLSGSPVFFRQKRVGRYGRLFTVYKFRTMVNRINNDSPVTIGGDSRVTPFGRLMRKFKLDELPQIWNVLKGDMSFVGARPDVPGYMDKLKDRERILLESRPGVTGPATLKYRNEEELLARQADPESYNDDVIYPDKVRINLEYLQRCSFWLDLKIILITIGVFKESPENFWKE